MQIGWRYDSVSNFTSDTNYRLVAAAAHQFPLLFSHDHVREKKRKLFGGGAITDGTTDAKNASVDGPLHVIGRFPV
jgi:hypothetical protein